MVELSAALNDEKASTQNMLSVKAELELALKAEHSQVYVLNKRETDLQNSPRILDYNSG